MNLEGVPPRPLLAKAYRQMSNVLHLYGLRDPKGIRVCPKEHMICYVMCTHDVLEIDED